MKEKDRLDELIAHLKDENIQWAVEIHGGRIWHAILKFPPSTLYRAQFARGYSVLAELDAYLPYATLRIRGALISMGRALKAGTTWKDSGQVTTDSVLALLRGYCCPGSFGLSPVYKSQFGVVPTTRELELLQRVEKPGIQQISVQTVPENDDWRVTSFLRCMLEHSITKAVYKADLISAYCRATTWYPDLDLAIRASDLKKLLSDDWLETHGFKVITQKLVSAVA